MTATAPFDFRKPPPGELEWRTAEWLAEAARQAASGWAKLLTFKADPVAGGAVPTTAGDGLAQLPTNAVGFPVSASGGTDDGFLLSLPRPLVLTLLAGMMNEVVSYGSCCECGSCVLVCPHNVIDSIDGKPKQVAKATAPHDYCGMSEGIGCDVCAQVCPRLGEREHSLTDRVFGIDDDAYRGAFGSYRRVVAARCTDPEVLARSLVWLRARAAFAGQPPPIRRHARTLTPSAVTNSPRSPSPLDPQPTP